MSRIKRIIFLHEHHFNEYYYRIFGIQILESLGYEVEVWSFMPFLTTNAYQQSLPPDRIDWKGYRVFREEREAIRELSSLGSDCIIMSGLHYTINTLRIYRTISRKEITCCSLLAMALPLGTKVVSNSLSEKIKKFTLKKAIQRLSHRIFHSIPFEYLGVRPVDIILAMGEQYFRQGYPNNEKSEVLWVHFFDYDNYLKQKSLPAPADEKAGVFLDEYLPFHPDNVAFGFPSVPYEEYFRLLRNLFDYLEKAYGVRITIAAHPRSHYEGREDLFGGRPVIRGKTAELVQQAGFVILHQSMSLNYSVLFRKPMVFITTDKVKECLIEDPTPEWLAEFFGKQVHNLNESVKIDLAGELAVDEPAYRAYQNAYIKKDGSAEMPYWEIVADRIRSIN
jgi:hypothetical protein